MRHIAIAAACGLLVLAACSDPETPRPVTPSPSRFKDLSEPEDVLFNLEASYNLLDAAEYDQLLDDDFAFYFSPDDYASGKTPEMWSRSQDSTATHRLLADVIEMDLDVQFGEPQWTDVTPDGEPDSTWITTTVGYNFTMRFASNPETTWFVAWDAPAQFTMRRVVVDGEKFWKLVEFADRPVAPPLTSGGRTVENTSWGKVKALYGE